MMKVLVATTQSQGELPGDYSWTVEGELVTPVVLECASPGKCGCGRGFPGLASARATTTAMVVDRPDLDRDEVWNAIYDSLERDGWFDHLDPDEAEEVVDEHVHCIDIVCASYPVGTVVGRWGTKVWSRALSAAA
jgi:hypothetical protein